MIDFACKNFKLSEVIKCGLMLSKADYRVLEYAVENPEWTTTDNLAQKLSFNLSTVQRAVKKLHEVGVLMRQQENLEGGGYVFSYKTRPKKEIKRILMETINRWVAKVDSEFSRWK